MIESINLNLIPSGVNPVCHVSQYDEGRQIKINLFEGINPYTIQSGDAFTLNVRKPDNTIVTTSVSGTQGDNYITISTTEQIAAVVGENLCELKIANGSTVIGTLNFIMQVERDVLADGVPSQSVIEDLDERIAEAIGDNYYNKTETDALLNNKADKSNTYNKTETDSLLALKADKSELYNVYPTEQESGAIASFTDGADNIPVKALVSQITAVESGSGEKSPTNPYTISGFNSGVITRCGKNLIPMTVASVKAINTLGTWSGNAYTYNNVVYTIQTDESGNITGISANGTANATSFFNIATNFTLQKGSYILNGCPSGGGTELARLQVNTGTLNIDTGLGANITLNEVYNSCVCFIRVGSGYNPNGRVFKPMVRVASDTDDTFAISNVNAYTFTFGQTVYGGHFDNKGNLVVTNGFSVYDGSENWVYQAPNTFRLAIPTGAKPAVIPKNCNMFTPSLSGADNTIFFGTANMVITSAYFNEDVNAFKSFLSTNNLKIVYELANPIVLPILSQDIPTALGANNIYSDTGDVDVTIRADIGLYIDKRLNANRSTTNNLVRAAAYLDDPESVNEPKEDNEEPQNEER